MATSIPRRQRIREGDDESILDVGLDPNMLPDPPKVQQPGRGGGASDGNEGQISPLPHGTDDVLIESNLPFTPGSAPTPQELGGSRTQLIPEEQVDLIVARLFQEQRTKTPTRPSALDMGFQDEAAGVSASGRGTNVSGKSPSFDEFFKKSGFGQDDDTNLGMEGRLNSIIRELNIAAKLFSGGMLDKATLDKFQTFAQPPVFGEGKYRGLGITIVPKLEKDPLTGKDALADTVRYYRTDEAGNKIYDDTAATLGRQFEVDRETSKAFAPLVQAMVSGNAQRASDLAQSVVLPFLTNMLTTEREFSLLRERDKLERGQAGDTRSFQSEEAQKGRDFTRDQNRLNLDEREREARERRQFELNMEDMKQKFDLRKLDLDHRLRVTLAELESGFRLDDIEGRIASRKAKEQLERDQFKLQQQSQLLSMLGLIGQFPQLRKVLGAPAIAEQFSSLLGVDVSKLFGGGTIEGEGRNRLPSAQEFARLTPSQQDAMLQDLAGELGISPQVILAEIYNGRPGGSQRIGRG